MEEEMETGIVLIGWKGKRREKEEEVTIYREEI